MNKTVKAVLLLLTLCTISAQAIELDTLYYDKYGKGVGAQVFASYYRVVPKDRDNDSVKPMRDFYMTGEMKAEGNFISIDAEDDSRSMLDGEVIRYFKDGKIERKGFYRKGLKQGNHIQYQENGLVLTNENYINGKLNGVFTQFAEDGKSGIQIEYSDGEPIDEYATLFNRDGLRSLVLRDSKKPVYSSPTVDDIQLEQIDEDTWQTYHINNLFVSIANIVTRGYGKYYQIPIYIENRSMFPVSFDPDDMRAYVIDKNGVNTELNVLSKEEFDERVSNRQGLAMLGVALVACLAIADAALSSSTTTYDGPDGVYTRTTKSFDGLAAFQAEVIAAETIVGVSNSLNENRIIKQEGYLTPTTVNPGESICGFVNIVYKRGFSLGISLKMEGMEFFFPWDVNKADHFVTEPIINTPG